MENEAKSIKDPIKLKSVLNSLQPMAARLMLHFLLTKRYGYEFPYTLYNMALEGKVKNPQRAIKNILDKGYMTRRESGPGKYLYVIHTDLIE